MVVYLTTNLINNKKYIGKDSNNNPNYFGSGTLLLEDIKKYGKENFKKEILEYCNTDEELTLRESYFIKKYKAVKSPDFYNLVDFSAGWNLDKLGEGKVNYIKQKISESKKGIPWNISEEVLVKRNNKISKKTKGKPKPKGFGKKVSKSKTGKYFSQEHKNNISKGKLGKKQPQSFLDKMYKPIDQFDKENNLIKTWRSIEEAANSNPKWKRSNISCCLTGKSKTAYGFIFKYS